MPVLGNRRSAVDRSRQVPGNRVPGALQAPPALLANSAAQQVAQESTASVVVASGEIGSSVQAYDLRLDEYAAGAFYVGTITITGAATVGSGTSVVLADATSAPFSVGLPAAASNDGRTITIKKTDASANAVTVDPNGSETIDGATTYSLPTQNKFVTVTCDGTGWQVTGAN